MDTKKVIGSRINEALAFSNKKQKELAAHLGVPDNTISYFCSGKRVPNAEQIIEISKFLGVSADFLLGLSGNKTTDTKLRAVCEYTGLNQEAVETLEELKSLPDDDFYKIQSWIISYGFLETFVYILMALKDATQEYIEMKNEYENDAIFSALSVETLNKTVDEVLKCDVYRYHLIKEAEKMANHFDQREQVQDNGKHNTPKE